jgi:hypothetical protein
MSPAVQAELVFPPRDPIAERFNRFNAENPHVFKSIERRALELYQAGVNWIGVKSLCEQLRGDPALETSGRPWKIDNSFTALIGRELIARHPELAAVIETRNRKSA